MKRKELSEVAAEFSRQQRAVDLAAKMACDRQAFAELAGKVARPPVVDYPVALRREVDKALPEVVPLAEHFENAADRLADRLKPQGTPGHTRETRGRKPKWDWERAAIAVLAQFYHGTVPEPETQAEVEARLGDWFATNYDGSTPGESLIREHARLIWQAIREDGN